MWKYPHGTPGSVRALSVRRRTVNATSARRRSPPLSGAAGTQCAGAGVERRARCVHVVDDQRAGGAGAMARTSMRPPAWRSSRPAPSWRVRIAGAAQTGEHRQPGAPRERLASVAAGRRAPPAPARRMQRHGHERRVAQQRRRRAAAICAPSPPPPAARRGTSGRRRARARSRRRNGRQGRVVGPRAPGHGPQGAAARSDGSAGRAARARRAGRTRTEPRRRARAGAARGAGRRSDQREELGERAVEHPRHARARPPRVTPDCDNCARCLSTTRGAGPRDPSAPGGRDGRLRAPVAPARASDGRAARAAGACCPSSAASRWSSSR